MAVIFLEGFDKYGSDSRNTVDFTERGEWTSGGESAIIAPGLSETGYSIWNIPNLTKNFYVNYPRLIGGLRFYLSLESTFGIIQFWDEAIPSDTVQCGIRTNTSRQIEFVRGYTLDPDAVVLAAGGFVVEHQTRYIEWDITFGNAAPYKIWLDGVLIIDGVGDTTMTANSWANQISLSGSYIVYDDLYIFDATGTTNNAPLLNNPRIETTYPSSDVSTQWDFGATTLGIPRGKFPVHQMIGGDYFILRKITPEVSGTLTSSGVYSGNYSGSPNFRGVVYADSAGVPAALLSSGPTVSTVSGVTTGSLVLPLTTPIAVTAGVPIWLGFMIDADSQMIPLSGDFYGIPGEPTYGAVVPFSSGAPSTAPALTPYGEWVVFGTMAGVTDSWYVVSRSPVQDDLSYLTDIPAGTEDTYTFGPLSLRAETVFAVAVKASFMKTDLGVRTVSVHLQSGATISRGPSEAPWVDNYRWHHMYYNTDPNTGAQWLKVNVNAALSGFKIDT